MSNELFVLLLSGNVGAVVGILLVWLSPSSCRQFARWSSSKLRTSLFAIGLFFFAVGSVISFRDGNVVFGVASGLMAMLQLFALITVQFGKNQKSG